MSDEKGIFKKRIVFTLGLLAMWAVGVGLFYFLGTEALKRVGMPVTWPVKLGFAGAAGLVWAIIGHLPSREDKEAKIAAGAKALKAAVRHALNINP